MAKLLLIGEAATGAGAGASACTGSGSSLDIDELRLLRLSFNWLELIVTFGR
jgi:hypothetical protein